jgi:hypothetical protein
MFDYLFTVKQFFVSDWPTFSIYFIQQCFIFSPSKSPVSEDAVIELSTVAGLQ